MPIRAKISNIITDFTIAINAGTNKGVSKGMEFAIVAPRIAIYDPDTGAPLGLLNYVKGSVWITEVYENFSLAESRMHVTRNIAPFPSYSVTREITKKLLIDPTQKRDFEKEIKVGDEVVQVITKENKATPESTPERTDS